MPLFEAASTVGREGGASGSGALDWPAVGADAQSVQFVQALFEDFSDALDIANPLGTGVVSRCTYPARTTRRETLILRNL